MENKKITQLLLTALIFALISSIAYLFMSLWILPFFASVFCFLGAFYIYQFLKMTREQLLDNYKTLVFWCIFFFVFGFLITGALLLWVYLLIFPKEIFTKNQDKVKKEQKEETNEKLQRLEKLKADGEISEDDYENRKKELQK